MPIRGRGNGFGEEGKENVNILNFKVENDNVEGILQVAFQTLFRESKDMMFIKDVNLVYIAATMPFVRMVGKEELKGKLVKILDGIVKRLRTDGEDNETKKQYYDSDMFRFTSDEEGFFTYNQLAILQLCTYAIPILKCLRDRDAIPVVPCSTMELEACRVRSLRYYQDGEGRYNPYADLICSILQCKEPKPSSRLESFKDFLETRLIHPYCQSKIQEKIEKLKLLSKEVASRSEMDDKNDPLGAIPIDSLHNMVSLLKEQGFHLTVPEEDHYSAIEDYYDELTFSNLEVEMDTVKMQLGWLQRPFSSAEKVEVLNPKKD